MNTAKMIEFLKNRVALFKHFTDDQLTELIRGSRVITYEANEAVLHVGEDATFLGVICSGEATVSVLGDGACRQVLGTLHDGDLFGEMGGIGQDSAGVRTLALQGLQGEWASNSTNSAITTPAAARISATSRPMTPPSPSSWFPLTRNE